MAELIARMAVMLEALRAQGDQRQFFHATYLRTTIAVAGDIERGGFIDPEWVQRWDIAFAELYLDALEASLAGRRPTRPWDIAFSAAASLPALRHVLLGMNAHINFDLPQALLAVISDDELGDAALIARREADHRAIDRALASRVGAEADELASISGPAPRLDRLLRPLNQAGTQRFLREAREKVWANAIALSHARRRGPDDYSRRLAQLEELSAAKVTVLQAPGQVLLKLATTGFGVRLPGGLHKIALAGQLTERRWTCQDTARTRQDTARTRQRGGTLVWHLLEHREMKRLARGRAAARPGPLPQPGRPAGTDLLPQIKHIVVLMMENHSYDNYLGMLRGRGEGFPLGADGEPDVSNAGAGGEVIRAFHQPTTEQFYGVPSQSWHASHVQWGEGKNDGFVTSAVDLQAAAKAGNAPRVNTSPEAAVTGMGYWSESDLPFYYGLARTFPLADRWFCSCLGPTFPNRRFLIAGTAHGLIDDSPYDLLDYPPTGTIFDMLTEHDISWVNYHPVVKDESLLKRYARHKRKMIVRRVRSAGRTLPAMTQDVQKDIQFTADVFPLGLGRYMEHVRSIDQFFTDAAEGNLPAFSLVDPDFANYSEENPQDIHKGESFAAEIINRVMRGSGWPDTLLIFLYDEHGGYYDHVPPPAAVPPDDVEGRSVIGSHSLLETVLRPILPGVVKSKETLDAGPRRYDQYGFRVPAVIVSPYARPDYVSSEVFDHTSVLKLVEEKWNLPPLTARDAAARSPLDALDLAGAPAFLEPPSLPEPSLRWGTW